MRKGWLLVVLAIVLGGCHAAGVNTITAPSASSMTLMVESGRTEAPLDPTAFTATSDRGATLIKASGYFNLRTAPRTTPILLWPADDGYVSASFTRALMYQSADPGTLCRLPDSVTLVSLKPDGIIQSTPWSVERLGAAVQALNVHPKLAFDVGGGGFPVTISVNAGDPAFNNQSSAAATYMTCGSDGIITGSRIVVRSLQIAGFWYLESYFQIAMTHEAFHATGIRHDDPAGEQGIMSATAEAYQHTAPTARELLIMKMQYERRPGTRLSAMTEDETVVAQKSKPKEQLVCVR